MTSRVKWGLMSTAGINRAIIQPIRDAERSELVAVASRSEARAKAYARDRDIPRVFGSYDAMLADPDIDAVYISLPNTLHAEWTIKAAEAGKHVLCEKPIVLTLAELDQVAAAAAAHKVTIFEAFMYLHHPQTLRVREMVKRGDIGQLQLIQSWFSFYLPARSSNIRLNPELGGGALWDVGVYPTSMAVTMAGELPQEVWAQQMIGETGVDVTMIGQLRFGDNVTAQISAGFRMPFRAGTILIGDGGVITVPQPWKPGIDADSEIIFEPRDGDSKTIVIPGTNPYLCEVEAMENCILDGASPVLPLDHSRSILRTVLALYESARTHSPQQP